MKKFSHSLRGVRLSRLASLGLPALALAGGLAMAEPAHAANAASDPTAQLSLAVDSASVKSIQLGVGRSMIVDLPEDAAEIFVGEPKVANAIVRSARRIYISTLSAGQTTIFALGTNGRKIAVLEITVGRDVGELSRLFDAAIPGHDVHIKTVGGSIILTGSVASAGEAQKALDIATGFLSGGDASDAKNTSKVVNSLTIRGLDQVSLRVTVSEIRRDIIKQLGINMSVTGGSNGMQSLNWTNPFSFNGSAANESTVFGWGMGSASFAATLQAYEQQGVARVLAEPTVTSVSGETAKFLAGGTIPIPGGESCANGSCTLSIVQQPYGVSLNFTPLVLSQGRIQLRIATEVTDVDSSKTLQIANTAIPGFRTRKNETTVELPSGGSIATAGLISSETQSAISGLPGLMNLPVLGALFRSRDYLRQETELLIVVTPFIVHAVDPKDKQRPDAGFVDASDPQGWLLGKVNRIYSSSNSDDHLPTFKGRVGFITD